MNNIVIFNDLEFFYNNATKFEGFVKDTFEKLKNQIIFTYLTYSDALSWFKSQNINKNILSIGTRPNKILKSNLNIKTNRIKDQNGKNVDVIIEQNSFLKLNDYVKDKSVVNIIEDAIVEGNTIIKIIESIRKINKKIKINIYSLICSQKVEEKLKGSFKNVNVFKNSSLVGMPIKDTTALFVYDLINNKINQKLFIENEKLLKVCFFESFDIIKNNLLSLKDKLKEN